MRNAIEENSPIELFTVHPFDKFNQCADVDLDQLHQNFEGLVSVFNKTFFNIEHSNKSVGKGKYKYDRFDSTPTHKYKGNQYDDLSESYYKSKHKNKDEDYINGSREKKNNDKVIESYDKFKFNLIKNNRKSDEDNVKLDKNLKSSKNKNCNFNFDDNLSNLKIDSNNEETIHNFDNLKN